MTEKKDFKPASTLHDDYSKKARPSSRGRSISSSFKSKTRKCEYHDNSICEPSREAVKLGLKDEAISCTGNIPPSCVIQKALADGKTILEILQK